MHSKQTRRGITLATSLIVALGSLTLLGPPPPAQATPTPTYPAARLINDSALDARATKEDGTLDPGGIYAATSAQAASLHVLENQAVADVIHDHALSPGDGDVVRSWGRDDAETDLWGRMVKAIDAFHAGTADNDQKNVAAWLGTVMQRQGQLIGQYAGLEYTKYAGLGTAAYQHLIATGASQAQLTDFLRTTPNPFTGTGSPSNPGGSTDGGYCTYVAPAPLQGKYTGAIGGSTTPETCYTPCSNVNFGCPDPTPPFADFANFGAADFQNVLLSTTGSARAVDATALGGVMGAVATVGAAGAGLGTTFALSGVMAGSGFQQSVFPFATEPDATVLGEAEAVWEGEAFDGIEALEEVMEAADAVGSEVAASGVGVIVTAIIFAVTAAIQQGLTVILTDKVPNEVAEYVAQTRTATADVYKALTQQPAGSFALFAGVLLPKPFIHSCDNSLLVNPTGRPATQCMNPTAVPGRTATDPQWVVTPQGSTTSTTQPVLTLNDPTNGLTTSTYLHGNWFVNSATVGGVTGKVQSLRMHYVDWDGKGHIAWVFANQSPVKFLTVADSALGSGFNPKTCQTAGTCGVSTTLDVVAPDGTKEEVSALPGAEPPPVPATLCTTTSGISCESSSTTIEGPTHVQVGDPVTYTAHAAGRPGEAGTVDFVTGSDPRCTNAPLRAEDDSDPTRIIVGKAADCTITFTKPGAYFLFATYTGDSNVHPSQGELTIQVADDKATTTIVSSQRGHSVVGQPDSFTARIFVDSNAATPGGTVDFTSDDGRTLCSDVPVTTADPFTATCSGSFPAAGTYDVHAAYSGDLETRASGGDIMETVDKAPTGVTIDASPTSSPVVGQTVTYQATVAAVSPGAATPTGTVDFVLDGETACAHVSLSATAPYVATCSTSYTTRGSKRVDANYSGDDNTARSGSTANFGVLRAPTQVTITPSPAAPVVGQQVTYRATVSVVDPGATPLTGQVDLLGGARCDSLPLPSSPPYTVSCTTTYAAPGDVTEKAVYSGDDQAAQANTSIQLHVDKAPSSTALSVSPSAPVVGQQVTWTATVDAGSVVPGGTVAFSGLPSCAVVSLTTTAPYKATCTTSYAVAGGAFTTATYSGDAVTAGSSDSRNVSVAKQASALALSATPTPSAFGTPVTLTATVSPTATGPTPTGSVAFAVDGTGVGTVPLSSGKATAPPLTTLAPGAHTLSATYLGDGSYLGKAGSISQTVSCVAVPRTGTHTVGAGGCVVGGTISGPVKVPAGASLAIVGATVTGPLTATGAKEVLICGSTLQAPVSISGTTGPVVIGGPQCAASTFTAPLSITGNQGGVTLDSAKVTAPLTVTGNKGPVVVRSNTAGSSVTVSTNSSAPLLVVGGNTIAGALACTGNTPAPTAPGGANHVGGKVSGQCVGLT